MAKKVVKKAKKAVAPKKKVAKAAPKKKAVKKTTTKRKSGLVQTSYSLSPELEAIVGEKKATRPQIIKQIWAYIKAKKLQDTKNKRTINPDKKLGDVIGTKPVDMLKLAGHLNKHIK